MEYFTLEIRTFGLGSKIQDMVLWDEPNIELECQIVCAHVILPLTASIVKNNSYHVTLGNIHVLRNHKGGPQILIT